MTSSEQTNQKTPWCDRSEELAKLEIEIGQESFIWPLELANTKVPDSSDRAPG